MKAKNRSFDRDPRAIFLESYPDRFPESSSDDPTVVFHEVYVAARQQALACDSQPLHGGPPCPVPIQE